ncbi:ABC transporter ATP-binding protein [Saccharopolyspora sp. HNM0983]|uniref:ABC transporter ATP-binding protein n=1 Tax=Saccharopolyspora montiporae TaxID=2781240 RepID=A0A929G0V8_9PSEU|nr:ABC transporter ATP-binding protein [Saccharopolyspora sp. HNM0983]MBE9375202.1 ABC transporter ATP-binding protein [Saccharopolyspora sp. HNM0983]
MTDGSATTTDTEDAVLRAENLSVSFPIPRGALRRTGRLTAVSEVSLALAPGEVLGLVGESGSGKSTTGRALLRLVEPDSGTILLRGTDFTALRGDRLRRARRHVQMVFQDPYSSLDPSMVVAESLGEPLHVHERLTRAQRHERVRELLRLVGLAPQHLERYPYEFSGGQRQRLAIARALATGPDVLVCDEAVSALDVSTQNQIINLLERLRTDLGTAYLFISHDLSVLRRLAQRVAVMYLGGIVEQGPAERVYTAPAHPYTRALLSAVPVPDPAHRDRHRTIPAGDPPDPAAPPGGCPFHPRCAFAMDVCRTERPAETPVLGGGTVRCHLHTSGPGLGGNPLPDPDAALDPTGPPGAESPRHDPGS